MTGERFDDDEDLGFDEDEFVLDFKESDDDDDVFADVDSARAEANADPADQAARSADDDDPFFVVEDLEGRTLEQAMQFGGNEPTDAGLGNNAEEDVLFAADDTASRTDSEFAADLGPPFDEQSHDPWSGDDVPLESVMGLGEDEDDAVEVEEVEEDPFALEDVELERIDEHDRVDEHVVEEGLVDQSFYEPAAEGEEMLVIPDDDAVGAGAFGSGRNDEFGGLGPAEADADWAVQDEAPAADDFSDPIYGDGADDVDTPAADSPDDAEPAYAEPEYADSVDYSEYEESFVDTAEPDHRLVAAGGAERRVRFAPFLAAAAILVAATLGAIAFFQPTWLGIEPSVPEIHRVAVARPTVDISLEPPTAVFDDVPDGGTDPVGGTDPRTGGDPQGGPDVVDGGTDPAGGDPTDPRAGPGGTGDPTHVARIDDPVDPTTNDPEARTIPPIEVGDHLIVHATRAEDAVGTPEIANLVPGAKAYAQLRNNSFFIGRVKKIETEQVTLNLEQGEVSLAYADLRRLVPLVDADEVVMAQHGFVRLDTDARLFGTIMRTDDDERVVLKTEDSRVSIPRRHVVQVGLSTRGGIQITEDPRDEWVQEQARVRLQSQVRSTREVEPEPAPPDPLDTRDDGLGPQGVFPPLRPNGR